MVHTPRHKPGQWDTGYYTSNGIDRSVPKPYSIIGTGRRPSRDGNLYVRGVSPFPNQGILSSNTTNNEIKPGYDFFSTDLARHAINMGRALDWTGKSLFEGGKTVYNIGQYGVDKFLNRPVANLLQDEGGSMPFSLRTVSEIDRDLTNIDRTFDPIEPPVFYENRSPEEVAQIEKNEEIKKMISNYGGDKRRLPPVDRRTKDPTFYSPNDFQNDFPQLGDKTKHYWRKFKSDLKDNKGQINKTKEEFKSKILLLQSKDSSQTEVADLINTTATTTDNNIISEDVVNASTTLANTLSSDKNEEGFWPAVTQKVNTFMDNLSDPGFQAALAMHMEAKDGGDVTDVLFAGVKSSQKSSAALMQSHLNEIKLLSAELLLQNTLIEQGTAKEPTKNIMALVSGLLSKYDLQEQNNTAMLSISNLAMQLKLRDPTLTDNNAAIQAVAQAEESNALQGDKWFDQFAVGMGWGGGEFDIKKIPSFNQTTNVQYYKDSSGRIIIDDGTSFKYADGSEYKP